MATTAKDSRIQPNHASETRSENLSEASWTIPTEKQPLEDSLIEDEQIPRQPSFELIEEEENIETPELSFDEVSGDRSEQVESKPGVKFEFSEDMVEEDEGELLFSLDEVESERVSVSAEDSLSRQQPPHEQMVDTAEEVELEDFEFPSFLIEEKEEMTEEERQSVIKTISKMNVNEKIKLATLGNKEARSVLVRDPNRLVAVAAVNSPKIQDNEIISISQSRSVCCEVIEEIARNREWLKLYPVKVGLANNPKTPIPTAMKMINHLNIKDLKDLSVNKNVSSIIQSAAKKAYIQKRDQRQQPSGKR
jgi:hypothetical protein